MAVELRFDTETTKWLVVEFDFGQRLNASVTAHQSLASLKGSRPSPDRPLRLRISKISLDKAPVGFARLLVPQLFHAVSVFARFQLLPCCSVTWPPFLSPLQEI